MPYSQIAAILAACAAANWAVFDRTKQGLLLATLCGLGAPISELLLMKVFHVWHYPRPGELPGHPGCPTLQMSARDSRAGNAGPLSSLDAHTNVGTVSMRQLALAWPGSQMCLGRCQAGSV